MPLVVARDRLGGGHNGLVLAAVEASHFIVQNTLKLNDDGSFAGNGDLLVEGNGSTLSFLIVCDVGGFPCLRGFGLFEGDLGVKKLQLKSVENNLLGSLDNLGSDAVARQCQLATNITKEASNTYVTVPL